MLWWWWFKLKDNWEQLHRHNPKIFPIWPRNRARSPALQADSLPSETPGRTLKAIYNFKKWCYDNEESIWKRLRLPWWLVGKESACNVGDLSSIPRLGRSPGEGHGNPHQCSCLEKPHGQRSLVGYSPWGCKESDTTEQLSTTVPQEILNNALFVSSLNFILTFIYFCLNTCWDTISLWKLWRKCNFVLTKIITEGEKVT